MSINWTFYKGKKILNIDYTAMDEPAMLKQMESYYNIIATETDVRQMSNFGGTRLSRWFIDAARRMANEKADGTSARMALVGISRYQRGSVFTYNFFTKAHARVFDSEQEAMEWLVAD